MKLLDVYAAVLLPLTAVTAVAAAAVDLTAKGQAPLPGHKPPPPVLNPYPSQRALHFTHSTFKVLIVTDTHLLDDQTVPGNATNVSRASTQAVESYLAMEKPDYVVHLGDIVSGEAAESAEDVVGAVRQVLGPVGECGGQWQVQCDPPPLTLVALQSRPGFPFRRQRATMTTTSTPRMAPSPM